AYYGAALLATGDQSGALGAFERALKDDPNNFDANLRMGMLLRQDEKFDQAMPYLHHALEIRPGDPGVRYQIASIDLARGNLAEAQAGLDALVKEAPEFIEAHVSLATVYYRLKRKADGDRERQIVDRLNARKQNTDVLPVKSQEPPRQEN
ncbi:MAG TPA: tetratricopeptide repeat protein, partial [Candidatus Dormibacteraeota bacterium]|nr:tetratricopeptide repeat protein [Candidatus Dormibacteraeota bacterium]